MRIIGETEYYNIKETAEKLGVERTTIYRYRKDGKIKATIIGRSPFFSQQDIDGLAIKE